MDKRIFVGDDISRNDGYPAEFGLQPNDGLFHSSNGPPVGVLCLGQSTEARGRISGRVFERART